MIFSSQDCSFFFFLFFFSSTASHGFCYLCSPWGMLTAREQTLKTHWASNFTGLINHRVSQMCKHGLFSHSRVKQKQWKVYMTHLISTDDACRSSSWRLQQCKSSFIPVIGLKVRLLHVVTVPAVAGWRADTEPRRSCELHWCCASIAAAYNFVSLTGPRLNQAGCSAAQRQNGGAFK